MAFIPDYTSYFSFPQGQLQNSGYSGVASYCKESTGTRPIACDSSFFVSRSEIFGDMEFDEEDELCVYGNRWPELISQHDSLPIQCSPNNLWRLADSEGRCLVSKHQFKDFSSPDQTKFLFIFNLYCPRNDLERIERQHYQIRFYHMLQKRALQLLKQSDNNHVIIVGDFNTTHGPNDVYDDKQWSYEGSHGRKWLQDLLNLKQENDPEKPVFVDAFRHLHPDATKSFTCWNVQLGCRITNFGSRLDYILIDHKLLPHLKSCYHLDEFQGSDHCPVVIEFNTSSLKPKCDIFSYSSLCTKSWPEFGSGSSQTSIKNFFTKRTADTPPAATTTKTAFKSKSKKTCSVPSQSTISKFIKTFKKIDSTKVNNHNTVEDDDDDKSIVECFNTKITDSSKICSNLQFTEPNSNIANGIQTPPPMTTLVTKQQNAWKAIFKQPEVPNCSGHNLRCVRRKSKKPGPNMGKEFFSCPKFAMEPKGHPETNCGYFSWISK